MKHPYLVASLLLTLLMIGLVWEFIGEAPPDRIRIAAGPSDGGYYAFAQRLAEGIRRHGVEVDVLETDGALENLERLSTPGGPLFALVQGGTRAGPSLDTSSLRTLATIDLEPVWIFQREGTAPVRSLKDFQDRRILGGRIGSGTHDLLELLMQRADVSPMPNILSLSNARAERALLNDRGDLIFSVVRWQTDGWVADLLKRGGAKFVELEEVEALDRNYRFLTSLTIPRGAIDLARNVPDRDVKILATATNLIVREDAHPATKSLVMEVLVNIDHGTLLLGTDGKFPNQSFADLPPDAEAARILKEGQTFFRRFLPYWLATEVERFYALLLPLATLLFPLWRWVPKWLASRRKAELDKLYRKLQEIDLAVSSAIDQPAEMRVHLSRLNHFERDLRLVHRKRVSAEHFMEFRRDIDRIRTRGQPTLALIQSQGSLRADEGTDAASDRENLNGQYLREAGISNEPTTAEARLARIQSDLDALSRTSGDGETSHRHRHLSEHLAPIREHLANARRSLLYLSRPAERTAGEPAPVEPSSQENHAAGGMRIADRIKTIIPERTTSTRRDTASEEDREPVSRRQGLETAAGIRPIND